jgi:hypothetical protein
MPARLWLSWGMKIWKLFLLLVLESLEFGRQVIRYALIFVSAFFRQRASLGCEIVAMRSQLSFYEESIRQKRQPRPRFHPAFRLLWVLLARAWAGWKSAADLMKPKTVLRWHKYALLKWWCWKSRRKGGRPTINQEMRALIRRLSGENVLWSAETIHGHLVLLGEPLGFDSRGSGPALGILCIHTERPPQNQPSLRFLVWTPMLKEVNDR